MIVDFHSHILPELDDGSKSVKMSLRLLKKAASCGITDMVATPHFSPGFSQIEEFLKKRDKIFSMLDGMQDYVALHKGAEVMFCDGIEVVEGLEYLTVNGRTLLLELPFSPMYDEDYESIRRLGSERNMNVVIAHIDRYPDEILAGLVKQCPGIRFQLNAEAFSRPSRLRNFAALINAGKIASIGSDTHRYSGQLKKFRKGVRLIQNNNMIAAKRKEELLTAYQAI